LSFVSLLSLLVDAIIPCTPQFCTNDTTEHANAALFL